MEIATEEMGNGVTGIVLDGRLDIAGAQTIDMRFNTLAGSRRSLVVDLSKVSFLASMGIRLLVIGAKTVAAKGGKIVLLGPNEAIEGVLKTAGIDSVIPIHHDRASAVAAVTP
jgi:anti-sigma B factor antagonist